MQAFAIINNVGMMINVEEFIDKGVFDRGYVWNPGNCECECDKLCDVSEYINYENCKCRKRLVDKLVEECNEIVEDVKIVSENNNSSNKCSSCTFHIVLFSIILIINIGIATYFVYYKCMNHNKENISKYDYVYQAENYELYKMGEVKQTNIKNRTCYFYNDMISLKNFDSNLSKIDKNHTKALVFTTLDILQLKKLMIVKVFTV